MADPRLENLVEKLTPKQKLWIWRFVKHGNGSKASRAANYAEKLVKQQAHRMMTNSKVMRCIDWYDNPFTKLQKSQVDTVNKVTRLMNNTPENCLACMTPAEALFHKCHTST